MGKTFLQVRADEEDKNQASAILEELGTNLSAVVNMLLKQIIMTQGIPFEVRKPAKYTEKEKISEIKRTMEMENMGLSVAEEDTLKFYGQAEDKELIRQKIIKEKRK